MVVDDVAGPVVAVVIATRMFRSFDLLYIFCLPQVLNVDIMMIIEEPGYTLGIARVETQRVSTTTF